MSANASAAELKQAVRSAAWWYVKLRSPDLTDADRHGWQCWLDQAPSHRLAWQEIEQFEADLSQLPTEMAGPALRAAEVSRRDLLRRLSILALLAPTGLAAWQLERTRPWQAEYTTATGERREYRLADGSQMILNTASSVDVNYSGLERIIELHRGEILVQTVPDSMQPHRPLFVDTPQGRVQALGTRFLVRTDGEKTLVTVLKKRVRVQPKLGSHAVELAQGEQLWFDAEQLGVLESSQVGAGDWLNGSLTVVDMPLGELVSELSRYRSGILVCSREIAELKISGAFPLDNTDRAIAVITRAFPVKALRLTPYWVRLTRV